MAVKELIQEFNRFSGEVINFSKSVIMFSPNTPYRFKRYMRSMIGTPSAEELEKYLGINVEGNGKSASKFQPLVEKIQKKVGDWKSLALSHAGKFMLINSILASFCQHVLSMILIPKRVAESINKVYASFLWRNKKERQPIHWKRREVIELPKGMGGLWGLEM